MIGQGTLIQTKQYILSTSSNNVFFIKHAINKHIDLDRLIKRQRATSNLLGEWVYQLPGRCRCNQQNQLQVCAYVNWSIRKQGGVVVIYLTNMGIRFQITSIKCRSESESISHVVPKSKCSLRNPSLGVNTDRSIGAQKKPTWPIVPSYFFISFSSRHLKSLSFWYSNNSLTLEKTMQSS